MNHINADTEIFGVIGNPLGHTFSPAMHNAAMKAIGYNGVYLAFPIKSLIQLKSAMRVFNVKGLSVTIPYKIRVNKLVNKVDPLALQIGSINTIIQNKNGLFEGYNTDGAGAIMALEETGVNIKNKKVLVLGSGGAARAIAFAALKEKPKKLSILARNEKTSSQLLRSLTTVKSTINLEQLTYPSSKKRNRVVSKAKSSIKIARIELKDCDLIQEFDIIINTTPMGMSGHIAGGQSALSKDCLHKDQVVFDIVYNPEMTPLLKNAKSVKAQVVQGYKMLLYQGVLQFNLFTGQKAPVEEMQRALKRELKKK